MDALKPPATLLVKLGSALVHMEELHSPGGHEFDMAALNSLLNDDEVLGWLAEMEKMALLPLKRGQP